jgi:hypothetical protein
MQPHKRQALTADQAEALLRRCASHAKAFDVRRGGAALVEQLVLASKPKGDVRSKQFLIQAMRAGQIGGPPIKEPAKRHETGIGFSRKLAEVQFLEGRVVTRRLAGVLCAS